MSLRIGISSTAFLCCACVGAVTIARCAVSVSRSLYAHYIRRYDWSKHRGEWAVVTGASEGIGRSIAIELARRGINIIAVARNKQRLASLVAEISALKAGVKARALPFDLTQTGAFPALVEDALDIGKVSILVNNVGGSHGSDMQNGMCELIDTDVATLVETVDFNVKPTLVLCRLFAPALSESGHGAIMNISSLTSKGMPFVAAYSASKAFVNAFSQSIAIELAPRNVTVQSVIPGTVNTRLNPGEPTLANPPASVFAKHAVDKFGYGFACIPYPTHALMWWLMSALPEGLLGAVMLDQMRIAAANASAHVTNK